MKITKKEKEAIRVTLKLADYEVERRDQGGTAFNRAIKKARAVFNRLEVE